MRRFVLSALAGISAVALAAPASAALSMVGSGCDPTRPNPNALACAGAFAGNLNNNARIGDLNGALDQLFGGGFADVLWADLDPTKAMFSAGTGTRLNFAQTLFGVQILSLHFGNAGSGLGDHTILYLFDFGLTGANSVFLEQRGWSNAVFITPPMNGAVPEPATWAMMLLGFGAVGFAMRRRKQMELTFRHAA
jgi:hypothetical protein